MSPHQKPACHLLGLVGVVHQHGHVVHWRHVVLRRRRPALRLRPLLCRGEHEHKWYISWKQGQGFKVGWYVLYALPWGLSFAEQQTLENSILKFVWNFASSFLPLSLFPLLFLSFFPFSMELTVHSILVFAYLQNFQDLSENINIQATAPCQFPCWLQLEWFDCL